jgi:hypothetical protein
MTTIEFVNPLTHSFKAQWLDYRGEFAAKTDCEPWLLEVERRLVSEKSCKQTERTLLHFLDERQPLLHHIWCLLDFYFK